MVGSAQHRGETRHFKTGQVPLRTFWWMPVKSLSELNPNHTITITICLLLLYWPNIYQFLWLWHTTSQEDDIWTSIALLQQFSLWKDLWGLSSRFMAADSPPRTHTQKRLLLVHVISVTFITLKSPKMRKANLWLVWILGKEKKKGRVWYVKLSP